MTGCQWFAVHYRPGWKLTALGLSLGKINYCLKAVISRGLVKVNNFRRSDNQCAYAYLLTPQGIEEKAR